MKIMNEAMNTQSEVLQIKKGFVDIAVELFRHSTPSGLDEVGCYPSFCECSHPTSMYGLPCNGVGEN